MCSSDLAGAVGGAGAAEALGEAEVDELEAAAAAGEDHVGGLEVAVHDDGVAVVEVAEGAEDVEGPLEHLRSGPITDKDVLILHASLSSG